MESFETSRLSAERLRERHLANLVSLHLDPQVMRYMGGVRLPEATSAYLAANIHHWDQHGFGIWMLRRHAGEFVGRAGIRHVVVNRVPEVEIIFALRRACWGSGLATEIAEALVNLGFSRLNLSSMLGVAEVENVASRRVLEKSGFAFEQQLIHQGRDCVISRRRPPTTP